MDKISQSKGQLFICAFKKEKCLSYAGHNCGTYANGNHCNTLFIRVIYK